MPIDFFQEGKKYTSGKSLFGLCDDSVKGTRQHAYLDETTPNNWVAMVHNYLSKKIDFYAIDSCVKWSLSNGNQAKTCDGMLAFDSNKNIIFVELKDQDTSYLSWKIKAEEQLKSTLDYFRNNHDTKGMTIKAYICNKQALFDEGNPEYMEKFKVETGVTLRVFREIHIK